MDTATAVAVYYSSNTLVYIGEVTANGMGAHSWTQPGHPSLEGTVSTTVSCRGELCTLCGPCVTYNSGMGSLPKRKEFPLDTPL